MATKTFYNSCTATFDLFGKAKHKLPVFNSKYFDTPYKESNLFVVDIFEIASKNILKIRQFEASGSIKNSIEESMNEIQS